MNQAPPPSLNAKDWPTLPGSPAQPPPITPEQPTTRDHDQNKNPTNTLAHITNIIENTFTSQLSNMVENTTNTIKTTMEPFINEFLLQTNKMAAHLEQLTNKLKVPPATYSMNDTKANLGHSISTSPDQEDITDPFLLNSSDKLEKWPPTCVYVRHPQLQIRSPDFLKIQSEIQSNISEFPSNMEKIQQDFQTEFQLIRETSFKELQTLMGNKRF